MNAKTTRQKNQEAKEFSVINTLSALQFTPNVIHFTESYEKYVGFHFYTSNSKNIVN